MKLHNEDLIKKWEQLRLEAYMPTPDDVWTIGWGHTKGVYEGMVITRKQAQDYFEDDIRWAERAVNQLVKVGLSQNQYDALVSFVFNIGTTQFKKSTCLKRLNAGNYEGAAEAMTWFNKQKGKVLRGLVRRREEERDYFLKETQVALVDEKSITPDDEVGLKPLTQSKEMIGGGVLMGVAGILEVLSPDVQKLAIVAMLVLGAFFVWNRWNARRKGER